MRWKVRVVARAPWRRWQAASVVVGLVVLGAGVGVGTGVRGTATGATGAGATGAGATGAGATGAGSGPVVAGTLTAPRIDGEQARRQAVAYLVSQGVPAAEAGTRIAGQTAQMRAATRLRRQAPDGVRSVWIADDGHLKAAVTDEQGARAARAAGATPVTAPLASADLEAVRDKLVKATMDSPPPGFTGASFAIDDTAGTVIADYLFTSNPRVPAAVEALGDKVTATADVGSVGFEDEVDVAGATMSTQDSTGDRFLCTAAWAVDIEDPNGGEPGNGVMTAGHCFNEGEPANTTYTIDTAAAGDTRATGEFHTIGVAGDYGYLRLERDRGSTKLTVVPEVIEAIEEPVVGVIVCQYGAISHETCGKITRLNVTEIVREDGVNYLVKGLVRTNGCSQTGDSGAPVYVDYDHARSAFGVAGLGIHSGSMRNSRTGACTTSFTPLVGIDNQNKYHVRISGG